MYPTNNIIPPNDTPDRDLADDGVIFPITVMNCNANTFDYIVTVVTPQDVPLYVNSWIDWNKDGDWDDSFDCPDGNVVSEWAVQNQELILWHLEFILLQHLHFLHG